MSEYDDSAVGSSVFKSKECSSSIFYEDNEIIEELSKIISNDASPNMQEENMKELKERNELKSAYKKQELMTNESIREGFDESKIKATDIQLQSNLNNENYEKLKSNEVKEEDLYLKIEDFPDNPISEKGKRLEVMVENTYGFDKYLKDQMIEELCFLKRVINSWRGVAGDGNCFYRSVIFSWLEYLIFNKKVNILKIVISNLYVKFDVSYGKTKTIPVELKKYFTTEEKYIAITLLEIIIRFIEKDNIEEAYITLIKGFNVTRTFDRIMILYLRFLLYEYISDNKDKLFKKDFPVLLGNLLPQEYETPDGKFLYNDYFMKDLLKFYTCAEKLAVYLVPFILKVNLNIVFYYFGKDCDIENKFFSCELPNNEKKLDTINVLFRKAHYDVCYFTEYYNRYQKLLNIYFSLNTKFHEDFYLLDPIDVMKKEKILNKEIPYDENKSVLFNRLLYEKQKNEKNQKKNEKKDKAEENKIDTNDVKKFSKYIYDGIMNNKSSNFCFICNKDISKEDIKEILPCNCTIKFCSNECKNNYYKYLSVFFKTMDLGINIKCGKCNNIINRTKFLENFNIQDENVKKALKSKILEFFNMYCMNCLNQIGDNAKTIKCKCPQLHKLLDSNKFEHKLCKQCRDKSTGNCKICNLYHSRLIS